MPKIKVLSQMDWPTWVSPTQVRLDVRLMVQVDDEVPFDVLVPKDQLSDGAIRQAVQAAIAERERRQQGGAGREIPL